MFQDSPDKVKYAEYVFVYCSLPTAGSIIVFAQQYDIASKDAISGAAVLVLLMWAPFMFTTAALLIGESIAGAGLSEFSHYFSIFGAVLLLFISAISPDWQTYPKFVVPHIALAALLFSAAHVGCLQNVKPYGDENHTMAVSMDWYLLTYFGRLWLRMVLGLVVPADLLLLWTKGREAAANVIPITTAIALLIAVVSTIAFAASPDEQEGSQFACWYRYGKAQVTYDLVLLLIGLLFKGFVLTWVTYKPALDTKVPSKIGLEGCPALGSEDARMESFQASNINPMRGIVKDLNSAKDASSANIDDISVGGVLAEVSKEENEYHAEKSSKCGVSGEYVYRLKILTAINLASTLFQILGNITEHSPSTEKGTPIMTLIQMLNIFCYDGMGMLAFLVFHSMRCNGWVKVQSSLRQFFRSLQVSI